MHIFTGVVISIYHNLLKAKEYKKSYFIGHILSICHLFKFKGYKKACAIVHLFPFLDHSAVSRDGPLFQQYLKVAIIRYFFLFHIEHPSPIWVPREEISVRWHILCSRLVVVREGNCL
uniref:Uncharacterized protein n=1 Tax=Cacopsylla melanoneura TaxID=428564 RepID=A0A8D8WUD9_9HEMI